MSKGFFAKKKQWLYFGTVLEILQSVFAKGGPTIDCVIWLAQIRVQHLVSGSTTLECDIWSGVEPH